MKYMDLSKITLDDVGKNFLVFATVKVQRKTSKKTGPYLVLTISDSTNSVTSTLFSDDQYFKYFADKKEVKVELEIKIKEVKTSTKTGNFVDVLRVNEVLGRENAAYNKEEVSKYLKDAIAEIENNDVKKYVSKCFKEVKNFSVVPYSLFYYYNFEGGLFCYTYDAIKLYKAIRDSGVVDNVDNDIILATFLTHRLGKTKCYKKDEDERFIETNTGLVNEDDVMTYSIVAKHIDDIKDVEVREMLRHCLFSSKLHRSWGSAVEAKSKEAKLIHYIEKIVLTNNEFAMISEATSYDKNTKVIKGAHGEYYLIKDE